MALEPVLIVPDTHRPYHDKRAWALFLKVGRALKPKHLYIIGDFADMYTVSSHSKDPKRALQLDAELADVMVGLNELDALGATHKTFIAGNHCLTPDHRVLSQRGWLHWTNIKIGESVATRRDDGVLEWQPVQRIISRMTAPDEALYVKEARGFSTAVTEKHRIFGHSNNVTWVKHADECADTFDVFTGVQSGLPEYALTDAELRLAAWASTGVHYASNCDRITFYQSEGKHTLVAEALKAAQIPYTLTRRQRDIKRICGKTLKVTPKANYEFSINAEVGRRIRQLTGLTRKGRLPVWVSQLSDRQWEVFLDTLIEADGSRVRTGDASVFNGQLAICEDVQIAAVTHGWRASISEYRPGQFRVNLVQAWKLRVQGWKAARNIPTEPQHVFCLTVPNGNFIVERHHKVYVTGNCDRLERYLKDRAPELFGVVDIPTLFKLKERGWKYLPYKHHTKLGKMNLTHDVGCAGRNATFRALDTFQHSVITGHSHRLQYIVEGNAVGEVKLSAMFGWLGDAKEIDYMHRIKVYKDWALGFGYGYLDPKSGIIYMVPVPIVNYTCLFNGVVYRG